MARVKLPPKKDPLIVRSYTLTTEVDGALQRLSQDASDFVGRKISTSAIVRALVRQVVQQGPPASDALFVLVEKELKAGVMWGKQK